MRSSDVWLGLPYDVFTFTMLQNLAAADLGSEIGTFYMNLGSSHLYASNFEGAKAVLHGKVPSTMFSPELSTLPAPELDDVLRTRVNIYSDVLSRPWDVYADALCVETNLDAIAHLSRLR
jgi:thymidylate synthase